MSSPSSQQLETNQNRGRMQDRKSRHFAWLLMAILVASNHSNAGSGTIQDVKHVVILMQENHSFDNYYGVMRGVRGFNDPNILIYPNGSSDLFQPSGTNVVLPFLNTNVCDYNSMGYHNRAGLSFYYSLADAYTICDANFCSFAGSTYPNRMYLFSGTIDPSGTHGGPILNNTVPTNGCSWTTYPERLQAAGVSWKVYRPTGDWFGDALQWFSQYMNASPGNPLYDRGIAMTNDVIAAFRADATNNTLPQVSWVIPPDLPTSEHPPYSIEAGEWFVDQIYSAIAANPAVYDSTVFILTYDEEGGYFDHIPVPLAPLGTVAESANGRRLGPGPRVPMIIASPWTRGGRVCSQVFDHTSVIRFLEQWTGVQETNISAWRRQVCGDLTSAFDFAHPDFSLPSLQPTWPNYCAGSVIPPPSVQSVPVQEPGTRPACPLPYQPDAFCYTDCTSNRLFVTMTNAGAASVHFFIYPNAYRTDGPWHYDVPSGSPLTDSFVQPSNADGLYDYTCYGPNGFQRRFAGAIQKDCGQLEISSQIDPVGGNISLTLMNPSANTANFKLIDNLNGPVTNFYALSPASTTNCLFQAIANNNGWYDFTVTVDADMHFLRHLAGHIENGSFSVSEIPVIVGNTLVVSTNSTTGGTGIGHPSQTNSASIYTVVDDLIAQNSLATAGTNFLALTIGSFTTNCAVIYPGWASNFVLETSVTLNPPVWTAYNGTCTTVSNCNVVVLPSTNAGQYFRLRQ